MLKQKVTLNVKVPDFSIKKFKTVGSLQDSGECKQDVQMLSEGTRMSGLQMPIITSDVDNKMNDAEFDENSLQNKRENLFLNPTQTKNGGPVNEKLSKMLLGSPTEDPKGSMGPP